MNRSFLGRGLKFPLVTDSSGGVALSSHEENIEESIRIILGTAVGERVYRPDFGCRIHDLLFAPNNAHTRNLVTFYADESLRKWEPRIKEIHCVCKSDPRQDNTLLLEIRYVVRATNSHYNMVYPFYLRREEAP
ncbi:MAG: GPW/gp25 family protein [Bradymonadia bacterium]